MTKEELNEILKQHKLWLNTKGVEGKRAILRNDDLRCANLEGTDLSYAFLEGANLESAAVIVTGKQIGRAHV